MDSLEEIEEKRSHAESGVVLELSVVLGGREAKVQ